MVRYIYDAWGNHKVYNPNGTENTSSTFIGNINPIRYRGYYYDVESGLYYLQTRYYDPTIGQFISPVDYKYLDVKSLGGLNLYAYCGNNPIVFNLRSSNSSVNSIAVPIVITNENHNLFSLSFGVALADSDKLGRVPDWIYSKVLYAKGGLHNGLNLAYIDVGVGGFGLRTSKFFGDNVPDFINPMLYAEVGVVTAGASVGLLDISAYIHLISGEVGISSDYISFSVKGYIGYGFKLDIGERFKAGSSLGPIPVGWEVDIQIDWIAIIQGLILWLKSYKK